MLNKFACYDNAYAYNNVYGHALELLKRNIGRVESDLGESVHLDIGCGFGRIAEPLAEATGLSYVGIDAEPSGLASLAERGFETHSLMLSDYETTLAEFRRICGARRIASISMLDTLEHLPNGDDVLRAIRDLSAEHKAIAVISVPNIAHRDVGFRLAFGQWSYTGDGLLDYTHTRLFSGKFLTSVLRHAGLHTIDNFDVDIPISDQHFPATHPALARGSLLTEFLRRLRSGVDAFDTVNQFVRACTAGPCAEQQPFLRHENESRPFLSIVMRTQGTRPHCMAEAFTCLAGQTERDFEVIVVGHRLSVEKQIVVEEAIEDTPKWLKKRISLLCVDRGNRTHPLNKGFEAATGEYISILDDDDVPFAHWVETFKALAEKHPGRLLRAVAVKQDIRQVTVQQRVGIRAQSAPSKYRSEFDLFEHLRTNHTPVMSAAFPRGVFHDLSIMFDENLTTTEDWDYIMRVALLVGVASSPSITSIYNYWIDKTYSSRTDHDNDEWRQNHYWIFQKMDMHSVLLPAGSSRRLRDILDERDALRRQVSEIKTPALVEAVQPPALVEAVQPPALVEAVQLLESTSWKLSAPIRLMGRVMRRGRSVSISECLSMSEADLRRTVDALRLSTSWRMTALLRTLKHRKSGTNTGL